MDTLPKDPSFSPEKILEKILTNPGVWYQTKGFNKELSSMLRMMDIHHSFSGSAVWIKVTLHDEQM